MTRSDLPRLVSTWGPVVGAIVAGAVAWTSLQHDVKDKLEAQRFERDSINVHHDLGQHQREIDELRANRTLMLDICQALPKCATKK